MRNRPTMSMHMNQVDLNRDLVEWYKEGNEELENRLAAIRAAIEQYQYAMAHLLTYSIVKIEQGGNLAAKQKEVIE